jgi:hypothetical protein
MERKIFVLTVCSDILCVNFAENGRWQSMEMERRIDKGFFL